MWMHILTHVPFEGPAAIANWAASRDHSITTTHLYNNELLPAIDELDMLVVMGGPMGIYDTDSYPWLENEREFIRQCIDANKMVLGVCLGAQQIAGALGAKVTKNKHREIGWFSIFPPTPNPNSKAWSELFSQTYDVFHWHGDTFAIPDGAELLASSDACTNQAFVYGDRVVGLQFHLETTPTSANALIENCGDELDGSHYVQSGEAILVDLKRFENINLLLYRLLDHLSLQAES